MRRAELGFFTLFVTAPVFAQVGAPWLGYVPDGGRLRPVFGIPASATVAGAIDSGVSLARLVVSPQQDYALGVDAESGRVMLLAGSGAARAIEGAGLNPDRVVLSPRGAAAVVWVNATNRGQVLAGFPAAAGVAREIDASFLKAAPDALAVSDDGRWVAGAWEDGVYLFAAGGQVSRLPLDGRARALAFYHNRADLLAATENRVIAIADVGGRALASEILNSGDSTWSPIATAVSFDNRRVVVLDASGAVLTVELSSGAVTRATCDCAPEGLFAMGPYVFRLTGIRDGAFKLFDVRTGEVWFAPIAASQEGEAH